MQFKDHFSGHAANYARFRPDYPTSLFVWLAQQAPATGLAWEAGCGNGQASRQLATFFNSVIATDASNEQIRNACGPKNVEFRVALAESSDLAESSADLICVAQALHWFDTERFYAEAVRVGKDAALLAVWGYGSPRVSGIDPRPLRDFEFDVVEPHWPAEREWINQRYQNVRLPGQSVAAPQLEITQRWSLRDLLGYVESWSALRRCRAATGADPLPALAEELAREWGDPAGSREISWPLYIRASRLPGR